MYIMSFNQLISWFAFDWNRNLIDLIQDQDKAVHNNINDSCYVENISWLNFL